MCLPKLLGGTLVVAPALQFEGQMVPGGRVLRQQFHSLKEHRECLVLAQEALQGHPEGNVGVAPKRLEGNRAPELLNSRFELPALGVQLSVKKAQAGQLARLGLEAQGPRHVLGGLLEVLPRSEDQCQVQMGFPKLGIQRGGPPKHFQRRILLREPRERHADSFVNARIVGP